MVWEIEFEDYKSMRSFRKKVKEILHIKPRIICNHYDKQIKNLNCIYDMGYLGYYTAIEFWQNKGDLKIKGLWEISLCDRNNWCSIKQIFKSHGEEFKK